MTAFRVLQDPAVFGQHSPLWPAQPSLASTALFGQQLQEIAFVAAGMRGGYGFGAMDSHFVAACFSAG